MAENKEYLQLRERRKSLGFTANRISELLGISVSRVFSMEQGHAIGEKSAYKKYLGLLDSLEYRFLKPSEKKRQLNMKSHSHTYVVTKYKRTPESIGLLEIISIVLLGLMLLTSILVFISILS